jgi:hypothetical protein
MFTKAGIHIWCKQVSRWVKVLCYATRIIRAYLAGRPPFVCGIVDQTFSELE